MDSSDLKLVPSNSSSVMEMKGISVFDGTFFHAWRKQVMRELDASGLLRYIEDIPDFDRITSTGKIVLDISTTCLDKRIATKVLSCNTSSEIWDRLHVLYQSQSTVNVDRLESISALQERSQG